jgi:ribonuclease G
LKTEILISTDDWENRVAVLEEGALAEIYFEREEKVIGSILKGRVENVLPGMGACFVNIGLGRNAFLYVDDIRRDPINIGEEEMTERRRGHTVGELLKVGDEILVQIVKEPRGLKGARVSTNISLPGRFLVLMPTGRYSGVSSRIEDEKERDRLKHIMRKLRPEGMATIVRTAAAGVSEAELLADLGVQVRLWHTILESYRRSTAPALLHKDLNLVFKAVRDFLTSDVESVIIDSKEQYEEIRSTMSLLGPQYLNRLKLWQGPGNLFEVRGIDEELQKLLKPKIFLPSGGHLVIESTEALTVVDVNTGKFTGGRNLEDTIVRTNIEAAAEIARQVRLRDIGGIIVVDFIDMSHERSREQVIATLSEALRRDRTRSTIQMFSNLGLLEFTRKRVGKDLAGQLRSECPYCGGLGDVMSSETLAISLLRQIRQNGMDQGSGKNWDIVTDPSVATQLMGWYREEFEKLAKTLNSDLRLFVQPQRHREQTLLEPAQRQRRPIAIGKEVEADLLPVRFPDPAAGVAVVDNWLIEVKDAAAGVGQTVKLKVTAVEGNLVRADLSEPLAVAKRRRRRRGKAAIEADEPAKPLPPAQPTRIDRIAIPRNVFGLEEDEEEDYTLRGRPAGSTRGVSASTSGRAAATSGRAPARGRDETRSPRGGRGSQGRRGRGPAELRGFKPLVVGGESDIDYDDDDESSVVVVPDKTKPVASIAPSSRVIDDSDTEAGALRRRRRRRGRGGRKPAETRVGEPVSDLEEDDVVVRADSGERDDARALESDGSAEHERRPRRFSGPIRQLYGAPVEINGTGERRPRPPREASEAREPREPRETREQREVREPRETRVPRERESREPRAPRGRDSREPREVRAPRDVDSREPREPREPRTFRGREPREAPDRAFVREPRAPRDVRGPGPARPAQGPPAYEDDELETIVEPTAPAVIDIDFVAPGALRPRRDDRATPHRDEPERGPQHDGQPREERAPRGRGDRGDRGGRDRGGRGGPRSAPRTGPAMKQLYPAADVEPEPVEEATNGRKPASLGKRRPSHGALFGGPGGRPPKGKVRQLYPPAPLDETAVAEGIVEPLSPERDEVVNVDIDRGFDETGTPFETAVTSVREPWLEPEFEPKDSLFVSSEEELEERRRRARERAEQRRIEE